MPEYKSIIDKQAIIKTQNWGVVFCRNKEVKDTVPLHRWFWFCFLEILFGEELLENLIMTSGNSGIDDPNRKFGEPLPLSLHIPSGIFSNFCHNQLVDLLYYKFFEQYKLLEQDDSEQKPHMNEKTGTLELSGFKFRFVKHKLCHIIAFRRVYQTTALILNAAVDLIIWSIWRDLQLTIIVGLALESIRRLFKL